PGSRLRLPVDFVELNLASGPDRGWNAYRCVPGKWTLGSGHKFACRHGRVPDTISEHPCGALRIDDQRTMKGAPVAAASAAPRGPPGALTRLQRRGAESIHIMREVAAECERPVMLSSIGKDSGVMLHLALKAFHPGTPPFPLLHVDTTWKFRAMYEF